MTPGQDFMREHASDMRAGAVKPGAPSWSGEVDGFSDFPNDLEKSQTSYLH